MSVAFLVVGVLLVAYLTLMTTMASDVSARGGRSGIEASDGQSSNGEISNGEISNGEDSNGEILHPNGEVLRKEQFKRH
jgi:hypothetical protein